MYKSALKIILVLLIGILKGWKGIAILVDIRELE